MISASDRKEALRLIDEATDAGARINKACEELGISERTYYRWVKEEDNAGICEDSRPTANRPEPANKISEDERQAIIAIVNDPEYASMPPCQIVPSLADKGEYIASESTFYRVLREEKMQNHRGLAKAPHKHSISTHKADGINQVWTWDITYLYSSIRGVYYYLYMIIDIYSRNIVGWEVWEEESAEHASELIKRATLSQGVLSSDPLVLHSDNGSPMKGSTMLATLYNLGITPSNSRPRVSNDNPYSESLFKTLKYRPNYQPKGFKNLDEARLWCSNFVDWYRYEHHHSGIKFLTPAQLHNGEDETILSKRKAVYESAKATHPERWNGRNIRNWNLDEVVYLNPEKEMNETKAPRGLESA